MFLTILAGLSSIVTVFAFLGAGQLNLRAKLLFLFLSLFLILMTLPMQIRKVNTINTTETQTYTTMAKASQTFSNTLDTTEFIEEYDAIWRYVSSGIGYTVPEDTDTVMYKILGIGRESDPMRPYWKWAEYELVD